MMDFNDSLKKRLVDSISLFLLVATVAIVICIVGVIRNGGNMHGKMWRGGDAQIPSIVVDGKGEVMAKPDVAAITLTIESSLATQADSAKAVDAKAAAVIAMAKDKGIAEKDIKTESYNSYPKYSSDRVCYERMGAPCGIVGDYKIIGYTVSQTMTLKVRNIENVEMITSEINKIGVTSMSGPNFEVDDPDGLKAEARKQAIAEARAKAEVLAKDLGVKLGDIISFSEGGTVPMYYGAKAEAMGMGGDGDSSVPSITTGEQKIISNVSITYEIR